MNLKKIFKQKTNMKYYQVIQIKSNKKIDICLKNLI